MNDYVKSCENLKTFIDRVGLENVMVWINPNTKNILPESIPVRYNNYLKENEIVFIDKRSLDIMNTQSNIELME